MTKVFVVIYESFHEAENVKVTTTYEKAVEYIKKNKPRLGYITIEEWEVDGEFVDSYAYN